MKGLSCCKITLGLLLLVLLAGCGSLFSPVQTTPDAVYMLNTVPSVPIKKTHPQTLLVMRPSSAAAYNTTRIAYTMRPYQIAYYNWNRWAATPAEMFHVLLSQTLTNTHYFRVVASPPFMGQADYVLNTQILKLQQNYISICPVVELSVRVELSKANSGRVISSKVFTVRQQMFNKTTYAGVVAANQAMAKMLRIIAEFCVEHSA